jgi:hypothetical protein
MVALRPTITADDFFTGLFAALAVRHIPVVSRRGRRFDEALAKAFEGFRAQSEQQNIGVGFRIRLHPIHGDSVAVRDGIAMAVRRDLISLDNPVYQKIRLKLSSEEGAAILDQMSGEKELFQALADSFLQQYQPAE